MRPPISLRIQLASGTSDGPATDAKETSAETRWLPAERPAVSVVLQLYSHTLTLISSRFHASVS